MSRRLATVNPKALGLLVTLTVYAIMLATYFTLPRDVRDFVYSNAAASLGIYAVLEFLGLLEARDEEVVADG